jgi:hypothetical protein
MGAGVCLSARVDVTELKIDKGKAPIDNDNPSNLDAEHIEVVKNPTMFPAKEFNTS